MAKKTVSTNIDMPTYDHIVSECGERNISMNEWIREAILSKVEGYKTHEGRAKVFACTTTPSSAFEEKAYNPVWDGLKTEVVEEDAPSDAPEDTVTEEIEISG